MGHFPNPVGLDFSEVLEDAVRVEIELPWVMQLLRDTITKRVRGRGLALLEIVRISRGV